MREELTGGARWAGQCEVGVVRLGHPDSGLGAGPSEADAHTPFPVAPQTASRTGQTTPFGGNRKSSGCCRPTGRWTSTASWPTPASSSGPSTGQWSCGCRIVAPCASEPASPSPSSRPWPPSAASSVSPQLVPLCHPARVPQGCRSPPFTAQLLSRHLCCPVPHPACKAVTCPKVPAGGTGSHRTAPLRPRVPSGIRHPEELSLLRTLEKKEKKKKEKEPEEEVYDLTQVVLAGGEHGLGGQAGRGAGRRPGLGPGLADRDLPSRGGTCALPGHASPLLRQRPDRGLLPHAEPAATPAGPPPAAAPAPAQLPLGQDQAPQQVRCLPTVAPRVLAPLPRPATPTRLLFPGLPHVCACPQPPAQPPALVQPSPLPLLPPRWLDSSRCLMQQDVKAGDTLWLRFKYYSFFDLDPKVGGVRERRGLGHETWGPRVRGLGSRDVGDYQGSVHPSTCPSTPLFIDSANTALDLG